jgi:DNA-directed RNA polymerase subunit E'/Rpb7
MSSQKLPPQSKYKNNARKSGVGIYMKNIITKKICLPFNAIGSNIKENIEQYLKNEIEGKCIDEGYIRRDSVNIVSYSAGNVKGNNVIFHVLLECLVCRPVEGMRIRVIVKNVTKAGIRAEVNENKSPIVVFIARDHHYKSKAFSTLKEGDDINARVIGIRYELNDEYISIIGELVEKRAIKLKKIQKPKITIDGKEI